MLVGDHIIYKQIHKQIAQKNMMQFNSTFFLISARIWSSNLAVIYF